MSAKPRPWTPEESADCTRRWLAGEGYTSIARALNRTCTAVQDHIKRALPQHVRQARHGDQGTKGVWAQANKAAAMFREGWPPMRGSEEEREAAHIRAYILEGLKTGAIVKAA